MEKVTGYLVNPVKNEANVVTMNGGLSELYELLDCHLVEVATRRIGVRGKKYFDIICDEQGLFVSDPYVSAINDMGAPMIVGPLFICLHNDEGEFVSLGDDDIKHIERHVFQLASTVHREPHYILTRCEY